MMSMNYYNGQTNLQHQSQPCGEMRGRLGTVPPISYGNKNTYQRPITRSMIQRANGGRQYKPALQQKRKYDSENICKYSSTVLPYRL